MNPLPISVHILTRNSAQTLERALKSLPPCREILVVDGGSTDETGIIARQHGANVLSQGVTGPIRDFSVVRNIPFKQSTQAWILALDSDEELSQELREEITAIASQSNPTPSAYWIPRRYRLPDGRIVTHASTYPNERIYFFHRDAVLHWMKPVHERIVLKTGTSIRHLKGYTIAPLPTPQEFKEKNLHYLNIEAQISPSKGLCDWCVHRLLHTLRSRVIATVRLLLIWCIPHPGAVRLPLKHELLRFWYAWTLLKVTFPKRD